MANVLKPKRGMKSTLERINPLLEEGELIMVLPDSGEYGPGNFKVGDGTHRFNELPLFIFEDVNNYIEEIQKGEPNGVAPLNSSGMIDVSYIPSSIADKILIYNSFSAFPRVGEAGKVYIDKSGEHDNLYIWSGTDYQIVSGAVTYTISKDGSSVILTSSDGTTSTIDNVGGVEIRHSDPLVTDLYPGKLWIVI